MKTLMKRYQYFDYALIGRMDHYFREQQLTVLDKQYAEDVCYPISATMTTVKTSAR
ncbi:MAG: DUF1949 domain-containing protein [Merdibacter sp.]